jgi:hypothetical protein
MEIYLKLLSFVSNKRYKNVGVINTKVIIKEMETDDEINGKVY